MPSDTSTSRPSADAGQQELFLSYHSNDHEAVARVRQALGLHSISTFYDRADLTPGQPWFDELESALRHVRGVAVFIGKDGLGTVQKREMQFALARQAIEEKEGRPFPVVPVLLPGCDPEMVSGFLALNTWVDLRRDLEDARAVEPFVRALRQPAAKPQEAAVGAICPYRGLNAFREEDAPLFFGRAAFAHKLLGQIFKQGLVTVIGRSGSGKSSVVQAGLMPLLRLQRPPDDTWEAIVFTPGSKPFHRLAAQLVPLWSPPDRDQTDIGTESEKLGTRLAAREVTLASFVDLALKHLPDTSRLLAVVDQFEELFTQSSSDDLRHQFVDQLLEATRESKLKVALTLRADFYGKAIGLRNLSDAIEAGVVNVAEMTREELKAAVEEPARRPGLSFESGLVERILDHVQQQPGSLPLLEYALTELWRRREGGQLTHAAYDAIGGVEGAISKRAEEQFKKLSAPQRDIALPALSRLVHVSSAAEESTDTRHVVSLNEFGPDAQAVMRILAAREARLVVMGRDETSGNETVEVAHEALIRGWSDLKQWIDKDREFLLWRQQLDRFLEKWRGLAKDRDSALLHGVYLAEALRWLRERSRDLSAEEREFIEASEEPKIRSKHWKQLAAAIAAAAVLAACLWLWWTRRDAYQIQKSLAEGAELIGPADVSRAAGWLTALTASGRIAEAMSEARLIADTATRGKVLAVLAQTMAKAGHNLECVQLAQEALGTVPRMDAQFEQDTATSDAVDALALSGHFDDALAAVRGINNPQSQGRCLAALARTLAETGQVDKLMVAARHPDGPLANESGLAQAARSLAAAGHPDEGLTLARMTQNPVWRAYALGGVAEALGQAGNTAAAGPLAEEALGVAEGVQREPDRSDSFGWAVRALAEAGKPAEALRVTEGIQGKTSHDQALADTAERLAGSGQTAEALEIPRQARDPKSASVVYGGIVTALAQAGKAQEVAHTLALFRQEGIVAVNMGRFVDRAELVEVLVEKKPLDALALARQVDEPGPRRHLLATIAKEFQRRGNLDEARNVALEALAVRVEQRRAVHDRIVYIPAGDCATLMVVLWKAGMSKQARKAGDEALATAANEGYADAISLSLQVVAEAFARIHAYRQARLTAEQCTSFNEKLEAVTAILREYTIEHHPEAAKLYPNVAFP